MWAGLRDENGEEWALCDRTIETKRGHPFISQPTKVRMRDGDD